MNLRVSELQIGLIQEEERTRHKHMCVYRELPQCNGTLFVIFALGVRERGPCTARFPAAFGPL
jgi:hypothetical protein